VSDRIGLFGGTFDPPHLGHVALAVEARYQLGLDTVLFVVANDPWQKSALREVTPAELRLDMAGLAVAAHPALEVSDVEVRRGGPTYAIDTVEELAGAGELTLLLGADAAAGLDTWHRAEELRHRVRVGVADRRSTDAADGQPARPAGPPQGWQTVRFEMPRLDISSSDIRRRCAAGEPIDHLVAPEVAAVIAASGLYGFGG
jgi:nicotinate-nucleotide adenylyltransferase